MVSEVVGNLRLILCGLAMLGAQSASAGLLLTIDTLQDFHFKETRVEYNPSYHSLRVPGDNGLGLSGDRSAGTTQTTVGDLYLTAEMTGDGSLNGMFRVSGKLKPADDTSVLLAGSLADIQVDHGDGYFVFLTQQNSVSPSFASKYLDSGVQVSFRVTKLGGTGLVDAFGAPTAIGVLDESGATNGTPSIPVPGTITLFLAVVLPFAAVRRRR